MCKKLYTTPGSCLVGMLKTYKIKKRCKTLVIKDRLKLLTLDYGDVNEK